MALLVLIVLGATLGWLASIIARTEAPGAILRQIAARCRCITGDRRHRQMTGRCWGACRS